MCFDPVSMLAVAGAAASAYGALSQGAQASSAAMTNAAMAEREAAVAQQTAEFNATVAEQRAGERMQVADADATRQRTVNRLRMGEGRANAAASGLQIDGSPLEVLAFNAGQQAQDVESILLQGRMDSRDLLADADLSRWGGRNARISGASQANIMRMQGRQAETAGQIRAGTSLLTSAGQWGARATSTPATQPTAGARR